MSTPSRDQMLQDVTARATTDMAFRKRVLSSPAEAIFETFGVRLPDDLRIRFIEKPAGVDLLIVLPDAQPVGRELDDDDLDAVAGGDADTTHCNW